MSRINHLFYVDEGNSKSTPVIFIHGFPFSYQMWEPQIAACKTNFRVIAYDLRGHGQSSAEDAQYSIEGHVDDLFSLLESLKIEKCVLVGLSMGGYIALRAMERSPEHFAGLVLCDTKSEADSNEAKIKRFQSIHSIK